MTEPKDVAALMRAIHGYDGYPVAKAALKLAPLLFVRPGELQAAEWAEIIWMGQSGASRRCG